MRDVKSISKAITKAPKWVLVLVRLLVFFLEDFVSTLIISLFFLTNSSQLSIVETSYGRSVLY